MKQGEEKPDRPQTEPPKPATARVPAPKKGCFTADELPMPPAWMRRPPDETEPTLFDDLD